MIIVIVGKLKQNMKREEFTNYEAPMTEVIAVNEQSIICGSGMESDENEGYTDVDTSSWF